VPVHGTCTRGLATHCASAHPHLAWFRHMAEGIHVLGILSLECDPTGLAIPKGADPTNQVRPTQVPETLLLSGLECAR
jgi:hypothetical protein